MRTILAVVALVVALAALWVAESRASQRRADRGLDITGGPLSIPVGTRDLGPVSALTTGVARASGVFSP